MEVMEHTAKPHCVQSLHYQADTGDYRRSKAEQVCCASTAVGKIKENQEETDRVQAQKGLEQRLWADLVLTGLLDALQDTKVFQRANTHTLDQAG